MNATANKTRIQGVGMVAAKRADALVCGDVTVWNGGHTYKVARIETVSASFVRLVMIGEDGTTWARKTRVDNMIAVAG